jgi:two-component system sensor histidine kinase KdpD
MMDTRANPDELLKAIQSEQRNPNTGHLKIFFGYAAGVGKTYAMLQAAQAAKRRGIDVIVGYIEPHSRPDTMALLEQLEVLPVRKVTHQGIELSEFDLEGALQRKPQLILVDELAHTDAAESRHKKRYQDIQELLRAGIDVYTTVNVQHLESLNDMVAAITGITVRERIPDSVFDNADQVELVDIEPQDLIVRLQEGKVYGEQRAQTALRHFFTVQNLTALREIALRRCADRMNRLSESIRIQNNNDYFTDEHILVCLSSSPTNPKIIRTAARMANAFHGSFTALFVETAEFSSMSDENKIRLQENTRLAEQLGASVETTYGDDIPFQIAEYARLSGVSKIVIGRSNANSHKLFQTATLTDTLTTYAPNMDIYIIPDKSLGRGNEWKNQEQPEQFPIRAVDIAKTVLILLATSLIGLLFFNLGISEINVITVYILGVLITAVVTSRQLYSIASSAASVLVFNYLFTEPRFTLEAYDPAYPVTFLVMFIAACITGNLAMRIKQQARQSARNAYRTKILFDTSQLLQQADTAKEVITVTAGQLGRLLGRTIVFYGIGGEALTDPIVFPAGTEEQRDYININEQAVATWVYKNNKRAGATTETLSSAACLYLAVRDRDTVYGVVGIVMRHHPLEISEDSIVLSILGECALTLATKQAAQEREQAALQAKNEQLRANMLRMISHDLRTPLTSISGNAAVLLESSNSLTEEKRQRLYSDIYDDSLWLINLTENLLSVTKLKDGSMNIQLRLELLEDVITEALTHIKRRNTQHHIQVVPTEELILAKIDARLMVQVIINIVDNAIKYTPAGSQISISTRMEQGQAIVEIADDGPGITDTAKAHIFDMFYTSGIKTADSRRGLGLGLSLCKSIMDAHQGSISVADNVPRGTVFRLCMPAEEVNVNE